MHSCRYHALSAWAVCGSSTIASHRARICSIFSKSASSRAAISVSKVSSPGGRDIAFARTRREMSVQPSMTRSWSAAAPDWLAAKFSSQRRCHPGAAIPANHSGSVGRLSLTSTDDGVRWKTYSSRQARARCGTH